MSVSPVLVAAQKGIAAQKPNLIGGRLTLVSGTALTSSDVTGASSVFFSSFEGNILALWDGSNWMPTSVSDNPLSLSGCAPNTNFDIFAYIAAGPTLGLESVAWGNDVTRAVAIAQQNGIDVKSGDPTRRLVGTIRTIGIAGQTEDSQVRRFVSNRYNARPRQMKVLESAGSWSYSTFTLRQANGNPANQLDFVSCVPRMVAAELVFMMSSTTALGTAIGGIGLDSTAVDSSTTKSQAVNPTTGGVFNGKANFAGYVAAGRHFLAWLEAAQSSGGVITLYGTLNGGLVSGDVLHAGLVGVVLG